MAMHRPLIVYKSIHHGNTAKVAEAMAAVLDAEIATPEAVPSTRLEDCPIVGVGSGVYYGRMHGALTEWLRGLPDRPETAAPAFVFSTSGLPWLAWFWHRPLRRLLARKGYRVTGEFACGGLDTWGPLRLTGGLQKAHPDGRDLGRAREFAAAIARLLRPATA